LYVSVLKCSILAIILFELLLDPGAELGAGVQVARGLPALYFPHLWAPFGSST